MSVVPRATLRFWVGVLIWAAFAAILTAGIVALTAEPPPLQTCRLSDGHVVTLLAVTRGRYHHFAVGKPAERRIAALLPADWINRVGWNVQKLEYSSRTDDELVFWFKTDSPDFSMSVTTLDEHGNESDAHLAEQTGYNAALDVVSWAVPVYPRRGKQIGLRFWQDAVTPSQMLGEIWLPNPAPATQPGWVASPLPTTLQDGQLEVTLERLISGVDPYEETTRLGTGTRVGTRAVLRIREHGAPTQRWTPVEVTLSDATGNRWTSDVWSLDASPDPLLLALPHLWRGEPAWKLRFGLIRNDGFSNDDQWTYSTVRVSKKGFPIPRRQGFLQGASLEITGGAAFAKPPGFVVMNGSVSNLPAGYRIDAIRIAEHGRSVAQAIVPGKGVRVASSATAVDGEDKYTYLMPYVGHPKTVDVTFATQKPRFFEFTVTPEFLSARLPPSP